MQNKCQSTGQQRYDREIVHTLPSCPKTMGQPSAPPPPLFREIDYQTQEISLQNRSELARRGEQSPFLRVPGARSCVIFEKVRNRRVEDVGDLLKTVNRDTSPAFLEVGECTVRDSNRLREVILPYAVVLTQRPDALADRRAVANWHGAFFLQVENASGGGPFDPATSL